MTISFLDKQKAAETLPILFDLLYENMSQIAPSGESYETDRAEWLSAVLPAMQQEPRQILLLQDGNALAGYVQYYVNNGVFMVEEIQLRQAYQRTRALYRVCRFLKTVVPRETRWIEAYAHKRNTVSQSLIQSLGMECVGENRNGNSWHYRGALSALWGRF
ncbi:MAG: hypothetical protein IKA05_00155 [Clostridia bacterium]|nr:hypothetical protein [Clostridia bacterium]